LSYIDATQPIRHLIFSFYLGRDRRLADVCRLLTSMSSWVPAVRSA